MARCDKHDQEFNIFDGCPDCEKEGGEKAVSFRTILGLVGAASLLSVVGCTPITPADSDDVFVEEPIETIDSFEPEELNFDLPPAPEASAPPQ